MDILNTCFATTNEYRDIASYSHLLPAGILLVVAIFILFKDRKILNLSFFLFIAYFTLWLVGDWLLWFSNDYHLVNTVWSMLDYISIVGYLAALYFYSVFVTGKDIRLSYKLILTLLTLYPLYITLAGTSISGFDQSYCESVENNALVMYKSFINIFVILAIIFIAIKEWRGEISKINRKSFLFVTIPVLLFLITFALTGYISSVTYIYEIELYGLFVLPVFILFMLFAVNKYDVFGLKFFNQQLLAWALVPLVASQFFFLNNVSDFLLNFVTLSVSFVIVYLLGQNIKKENENRAKIEQLNKELITTNENLREVDRQKTEFISVASHQLRGPLTAIKGYSSLILEGDLGPISDALKVGIETIFRSTQALVVIVGDYLDASRIEQGRMRYEFSDFDVKPVVDTVIAEFSPNMRLTGLELQYVPEKDKDYIIHGDEGKIKQVISNIIDNAIKYTEKGTITVGLTRNDKDMIVITVKDTGVGISPDIAKRLFEKFSRAPGASRTNTTGTGLGLYVAKKMMEAHRGRIWVESEGLDKGSTFYIELDALHKTHNPINDKLEILEKEEEKKIGEEVK